jgi:acyl carrier protein phosphodiesterase
MEFKVIENTPGALVINYEELKTQLDEQLHKYRGLVVTEDKINEAKATRAGLNKVKTMIDDRRKELKKEFLKPYEEVDKQSKELILMIDTVNANIDEQIRDFENQAKAKKTEDITKLWESINYTKITLKHIWDEQWLNKTYSMKQIEQDLKDAIQDVEADLSVIDSFQKDPEVANTLKAKYLLTLNLNATLQQYEAEQKAKELLKPKEEPKADKPIETRPEPEKPVINEKLFSFKFEVIGTKNQLDLLTAYMRNNGLKINQL